MADRIACEFCMRIFYDNEEYQRHLRIIHEIDSWE